MQHHHTTASSRHQPVIPSPPSRSSQCDAANNNPMTQCALIPDELQPLPHDTCQRTANNNTVQWPGIVKAAGIVRANKLTAPGFSSTSAAQETFKESSAMNPPELDGASGWRRSGGRKVEEVNIVRVDQLGWGTNFKAVHYPRLATLSTFPVTMQSLEHHATTVLFLCQHHARLNTLKWLPGSCVLYDPVTLVCGELWRDRRWKEVEEKEVEEKEVEEKEVEEKEVEEKEVEEKEVEEKEVEEKGVEEKEVEEKGVEEKGVEEKEVEEKEVEEKEVEEKEVEEKKVEEKEPSFHSSHQPSFHTSHHSSLHSSHHSSLHTSHHSSHHSSLHTSHHSSLHSSHHSSLRSPHQASLHSSHHCPFHPHSATHSSLHSSPHCHVFLRQLPEKIPTTLLTHQPKHSSALASPARPLSPLATPTIGIRVARSHTQHYPFSCSQVPSPPLPSHRSGVRRAIEPSALKMYSRILYPASPQVAASP
ncbi:hypothetical protein Pcinc_024201 [Petrolisthes cinctipes]|uniref:Uncharacterized protein n=1 Tax=Petrolisthes cinctipes TaxID=88211 RepID=A0AAE1FAE2_PETCI|nr:hypothetical protein Pcinc_024201 [Petrolisthes cinctipes]